ncbi:MAG: hypothetical protein GQ570_00990 [Helicobacteraceae bacterium]|nr:hypothetical protein [Helicobacteraceae bacterium]
MNVSEQNNKIKDKWGKLFKGIDDELEPPLLIEELPDAKFNHYEQAIDTFSKKNSILIDHKYQYTREYDNLFEDEQRLPHVGKPLLYMVWLIFLVMLEVPTNYTTIEQFLHKPVVSAMVTIAIGALLVFIAHSHGKFFKQLKYINNTSTYDTSHNSVSRGTRWVYAIAGFIGLSIIMYGLYYARLQYFNTISGVDVNDPFAEDNGGIDLVSATIFTKVGILMLANFAIYILGTVGSYFAHDAVPGFQEAYFKMHKFTKSFTKEYLELKKQLDRIANIKTTRAR